MFSFNGIAIPNRSNMLTHEELKEGYKPNSL